MCDANSVWQGGGACTQLEWVEGMVHLAFASANWDGLLHVAVLVHRLSCGSGCTQLNWSTHPDTATQSISTMHSNQIVPGAAVQHPAVQVMMWQYSARYGSTALTC